MACASKLECNLLMKQLAIRLGYQKTITKSLVMMKQLAIRLGYQPKNFWPGTRKTITKSLVMMKQLAIRLGYRPKNFWPGTRKTITKSLVMMKQLVKQLAIPLGNQKTVAKWLVIAISLSRQKTATKWLVLKPINNETYIILSHAHPMTRSLPCARPNCISPTRIVN